MRHDFISSYSYQQLQLQMHSFHDDGWIERSF
jgi:hypothetical protein